MKIIAVTMADETFTRRELETTIVDADLDELDIDRDDVVVRTKMLKKLSREDGYLSIENESDGVPFVLYVGGQTDETLTGLSASELIELVRKVLELEGVDPSTVSFDQIDFTSIGDVCSTVNRIVGRTVLIIVSDPYEFRMKDSALSEVQSHV